jgi:hypothetical protein
MTETAVRVHDVRTCSDRPLSELAQHRLAGMREAAIAELAAKLAAPTAELRRGYFAVPGATEDGFHAGLPELLEQRRRAVALTADTAARQIKARRYPDGW